MRETASGRRQAPLNVTSSLDAARELGIRDAQPHLVLDSTGLSIVGAGEWAAAKHGGCGRRGWRKLHLGVDQSGVIRVHTLTRRPCARDFCAVGGSLGRVYRGGPS